MRRLLLVVALAVALVAAVANPAWALTGIETKWQSLGGAAGFLGNPTTAEAGMSQGCAPGGRYENFQGGAITWVPGWPAVEDHGPIRSRWAQLGYECGTNGFPVTDVMASAGADPAGRVQQFWSTVYGRAAIYFTPSTGAWEINGVVYDYYLNNGGSWGKFGYPTSGLVFMGYLLNGNANEYYRQSFQHGLIYLNYYFTGAYVSETMFG